MTKPSEFYKLTPEQRIVLDELRAWEDRKMQAESQARGARLILPDSSPVLRFKKSA